MKIIVIGTRGIPDIQGGVETHCQELYPRMIKVENNRHEITIVRRKPYICEKNSTPSFEGIKLHDMYAPHRKSLEAIVHTFLSIIHAKKQRADIVHIHAIGPALLVPFAKILGLKVVFTHHGPDYNRKKWGKLAKLILKWGEKMGTKYADEVIVISTVINQILIEKYHRHNAHLVYNGVNRPIKSRDNAYIQSLGLSSKNYILAVGRFVKEKGFHDLIHAFLSSKLTDCKLVIAGDADHEDSYSQSLKKLAKKHNVVLTGFVKGEKLNQLFTHAQLFVLPSYHEGLPITLLEAMSYDLNVLVSDIPANKAVEGLRHDDFFAVGDTADLSKQLKKKLKSQHIDRQYNLASYNWETIATQVATIYHQLLDK